MACTKHIPSDYLPHDRLYRGFRIHDMNEDAGVLEANAIRFPDFSCNWGRLSEPADVRRRQGALPTDGCFSFSVSTAQFEHMATPCHDPLPENPSHTEVRQLREDESLTFEPPKGRKLQSHNWSRTNRMRYRQNIINNMSIEFEPTG